jgi:hypothetical protein
VIFIRVKDFSGFLLLRLGGGVIRGERRKGEFSYSGICKKDWQRTALQILQWLFFQDAFEPVTDKGAHDKDDHEDNNHDKNTEHSQETDINTQSNRNKEQRDEHENNTENNTYDRAVFKNAHEIFLPMVKKAKCYTNDEIQQFKPQVNTPDLKQNITLQPLNRFRVATGISP